MPFDANLLLANSDGGWTYANLVTSDYGSPVSTTRNAGGFVVLDIGGSGLVIGGPISGLAVVLVLNTAEAAVTAGDALTVIVEECDDYDFSSSQPHELAKFDIAAATKGVILGSEVTGVATTVVRRVSPTRRYMRIDASCSTDDDFGTCWAMVSPYPFKDL